MCVLGCKMWKFEGACWFYHLFFFRFEEQRAVIVCRCFVKNWKQSHFHSFALVFLMFAWFMFIELYITFSLVFTFVVWLHLCKLKCFKILTWYDSQIKVLWNGCMCLIQSNPSTITALLDVLQCIIFILYTMTILMLSLFHII